MVRMAEHAADSWSKYEVGSDGRSGYERMKGKPECHTVVEFGEQVRCWYPKGLRRRGDKAESKRGVICLDVTGGP